ncbi:hypothetical protein B0H19DRAFT_1083370 [Mycena capillaripes]|nr:hypothetical protein B0H19DRAFT_1083370 [Mycena capillaripes]
MASVHHRDSLEPLYRSNSAAEEQACKTGVSLAEYINNAPRIINPETAASASSLPSKSERELYSFVERLQFLVSQINREAEDGANIGEDGSSSSVAAQSAYLADLAFRAVEGYDKCGRSYPPDGHVRILNSYIRRMRMIESIGSREMTAGTSVAASSLYQEQRELEYSRPPTGAIPDRDGHSELPSRTGSLSLAAAEIRSAIPELGKLVDRVRRNGSIGSTGTRVHRHSKK